MVNCDVFIRSKRRTLVIKVDENANVIVKAPNNLNESTINAFIEKKQKWIEKTKNRIGGLNKIYSNLFKCEDILYFGEVFNVVETKEIKCTMFGNNSLYIKGGLDQKKRQKKIKDWYSETAERLLKKRLDYFANLMQLDYSSFRLTNAKTKWGSCSSKQDIMLNWRLIMLKPDEQDYVIVHELCHLLEMNHSSNFYKCIESVLKDYKQRKIAIKKSSFVLALYR